MSESSPTTAQTRYSKHEVSRMKILAAAREMVMEVGYQSTAMAEIAKRANISRATLYRYYSTKEQLYNDVSTQWGMDFIDHMRQHLPRGGTAGERICHVIRETVNAVNDNQQLMTAHIATMISDDSILLQDQRRFKTLIPSIIKTVIGRLETKNLELATATLQHVLISSIILLNAGKTQTEKVIDEMEKIAANLFADIWDKT